VPPGAPMAPGLMPSGLPVPPTRVHAAGRGRAGRQMAPGAAGSAAGGVPGLMHAGNKAGMGRGAGVAGRGRGRGECFLCSLTWCCQSFVVVLNDLCSQGAPSCICTSVVDKTAECRTEKHNGCGFVMHQDPETALMGRAYGSTLMMLSSVCWGALRSAHGACAWPWGGQASERELRKWL
jgi:hypothetical protein